MSLANRLSLYISLIIIVIFCAIGFLFMQDVAEREERFASLYANVIVDGSVDKLDSEISRVEYHLVNTAPPLRTSSATPVRSCRWWSVLSPPTLS